MKMNRTVRDFQNALEVLLEDHPFEKLTIDQICKEAMLHRSSFYRYFHDKYDLLEQMLKQRLNTIWEQADTEDELLKSLVDYVNGHRKSFRNLTTSASRDSLYTELLRMCSEILLELRDKEPQTTAIVKALRASKNPELAAYSIAGSMMGIMYWWQEQNYDVAEDEVLEFISGAVRTLPAIEGQA